MNRSAGGTLRQFRYFVTLADELHFGRAAAHLGITQATLTRQIQELEKATGASLVERTTRFVTLTRGGAAFAEQARATVRQYNRSVETARSIAARRSESLALGFECGAAYRDFPRVARQFMRLCPDTRLSGFEMSAAEQAEALARRQIDVGFAHPPILDNGLLTFERVGEARFIVAMAASHRLASRKRITRQELTEEQFALYSRPAAPESPDAMRQLCRAAGFRPHVVHESNQISVSLGLIAASDAIMLYPECVQNWRAPGVVFRAIDGTVHSVTCGLLYRTGENSETVGRFLRMWRAVAPRQSGRGIAPATDTLPFTHSGGIGEDRHAGRGAWDRARREVR